VTMKIVTLPLFFLVYAKKNKSSDQPSTNKNAVTTSDDFTEMTNQELITDASGKLRKLGARAAGIYVEYLGDWSRADNYRHKHDKMQTVLMQYLKKCGYQKGQVSQLKDDWEVPKRTTKSKDKKNKKERKRRAPDEFELPTLHKHLNSMYNLWADFEIDFEDDEVNPSDLINQRGINSEFNTTGILLNDERNDERSQEIAAAYTKIRKLFNGYGIFSKMYLKECKKFSKVEKRISKTNERLVGAIGKFQQWQIKDAERQEREAKRAALEAAKALAAAEEEAAKMPEETEEEKRKRKKAEKKAHKAEKATKRPPPPEEDTFFGTSL